MSRVHAVACKCPCDRIPTAFGRGVSDLMVLMPLLIFLDNPIIKSQQLSYGCQRIFTLKKQFLKTPGTTGLELSGAISSSDMCVGKGLGLRRKRLCTMRWTSRWIEACRRSPQSSGWFLVAPFLFIPPCPGGLAHLHSSIHDMTCFSLCS